MATYQVSLMIEVPDVEAESEEEAIKFVRGEVSSVFEEPVRFFSETARNYDEGN